MNRTILTDAQRVGITILCIILSQSIMAFLIGVVIANPYIYITAFIAMIFSISWICDICEEKK